MMIGKALSLNIILGLLTAFCIVECIPFACNVSKASHSEIDFNTSLQEICIDDNENQTIAPPAPSTPPRPDSHSKLFLEAAAAASILLRQLQDSQDQESPFTEKSDLDRWGWSRYFGAREEVFPYPLRIPFESLGISADSPPNIFWRHTQDNPFQRDGETKVSHRFSISSHPCPP